MSNSEKENEIKQLGLEVAELRGRIGETNNILEANKSVHGKTLLTLNIVAGLIIGAITVFGAIAATSFYRTLGDMKSDVTNQLSNTIAALKQQSATQLADSEHTLAESFQKKSDNFFTAQAERMGRIDQNIEDIRNLKVALGRVAFDPGSNTTETMKALLDAGIRFQGQEIKMAEFYNEHGLTMAASNNHLAAIPLFRQAIATYSALREPHFHLAFELAIMRRWAEAEQEYRQALQISSHTSTEQMQDAEVLYYLATCLRDQGEMEQAADAFKRSIDADTRNSDAHLYYGTVLRSLKRLSEAKAEMDRSISINPENAFAFYQRALLDADQKDKAALLQDLKKVVALKPNYRDGFKGETAFDQYRSDPDFIPVLGP